MFKAMAYISKKVAVRFRYLSLECCYKLKKVKSSKIQIIVYMTTIEKINRVKNILN